MSTPSVLFVCVKNGGKSQMAAGLMRKAAGDDVEVHSAGTAPGNAVNALSAETLLEVGVDLTGEHPKRVDPDLLARMDYVITLGTEARDARDRGALRARTMFAALTTDGVVTDDGGVERIDAVVWCTGFRPALRHLRPLHLPTADGGIAMDGLHAAGEPTMVFLGYGDWTGPASATLIGVGRTARYAVEHLTSTLT